MVIVSTFLWSATWIVKTVLACAPSVFLPHVLNLGTRFLFSGGELSQPKNCLQIVASVSIMHPVNFKKLEMRKVKASEINLKEGQEPFKFHSLFPKCLHKCLIILARLWDQTKNSEHFCGIFWALNLNHYSIWIWKYTQIYMGYVSKYLWYILCAFGEVQEAT